MLNAFLILIERNSEFRYRERNSDTFDLSDHTTQAGYNKSSVDVDNRKSALVAFRNSEKQLEQNKTTIYDKQQQSEQEATGIRRKIWNQNLKDSCEDDSL